MKMLNIVLLVTFALISCNYGVSAEEWQPKTTEEIRKLRAECLKEHPLSDELVAKMRHLDFPDEEPVRQYVLCTALKLGIFCEHEGYHAERLAKQFKMDLDEAEALTIAQGCADANEQKSSVDVWAFRGHKCAMESKVGDRVRAYIKRKHEEAVAEAAAAAAAEAH